MALGQRDIETNWSRVASGSSPIHFLHKTRVAISTSWSLFYNRQIFCASECFIWLHRYNCFSWEQKMLVLDLYQHLRKRAISPLCKELIIRVLSYNLDNLYFIEMAPLLVVSSINNDLFNRDRVYILSSSSYRLIYSAHFVYPKRIMSNRMFNLVPIKMKPWYYGELMNRVAKWIMKSVEVILYCPYCMERWLLGGN